MLGPGVICPFPGFSLIGAGLFWEFKGPKAELGGDEAHTALLEAGPREPGHPVGASGRPGRQIQAAEITPWIISEKDPRAWVCDIPET